MTNNKKNCSGCGKQIMTARGFKEVPDVRNFGTDEKPDIRMYCQTCATKYKKAFGGQTP